MQEEAGEEVDVVVLTDEQGNEKLLWKKMVIPYEGKNFAVLVSIDDSLRR